MKFSFNQLRRLWQEGTHVEWQEVKSFLEKHLEVEVEEETAVDVNPSLYLRKVVSTPQGLGICLSNGAFVPLNFVTDKTVLSEDDCVLIDEQSGHFIGSDDELNLPEDFSFSQVQHDGLLIVKGAPEGQLREVLELPDVLIKLSVLPNRGDLSHLYGLAREIALGMGLTLVEPKPETQLGKQNGLVTIETDGCLVYAGMLIDNVHIEESPWQVKYDLIRFGQRPINNVVDLTNYFLFKYGQPMHAFDYDKLEEGRIVVRQARDGEKIVLLNGEEFTLDRTCMVIADGEKPVAVAGVMGGKYASVTEETKRVLLEVASFLPSQVAMSSRRLGVRTDASMLYERGVAPCGQVQLAFLFADMAKQMGAGEAAALWVAGTEQWEKRVPYNPQRIVKLASVKEEDLNLMLTAKHWHVEPEGTSNVLVIPSYRWDVTRTEDLADELVKFIGYDAVPSLPLTDYVPFKEKESITKENKLRDAASTYFQEVFMVSLISDKDVQNLANESVISMDDAVAVDNPVSRELSYLRPNLLVTLLKAAQVNQNRFKDDVHLFEIGSVFSRKGGAEVEEKRHIGFLVKGAYFDSAPDQRQPWSYREFKGVLENVLTRLYGLNVVWENQPVNWADSEKFSGVIKLEDGTLLGHMGIVKNSILKAYDLRGPVFAAEFDIDSMPLMKQRQPQFPLRFPLSWRDFSVVMPTNEPVSKLSVLFEGEPLVRNWQVVDLYRGEKLSPSEKSVTVRMWLGSDERTITNEEVDQVAQRVVERLEKAGWHLRA